MHLNYLTQDDAAEEELNAGEQALKGGDADEATGLGDRDGDPNIAADAEALEDQEWMATSYDYQDGTLPEDDEDGELPEWACRYCGIADPACVVKCIDDGKVS